MGCSLVTPLTEREFWLPFIFFCPFLAVEAQYGWRCHSGNTPHQVRSSEPSFSQKLGCPMVVFNHDTWGKLICSNISIMYVRILQILWSPFLSWLSFPSSLLFTCTIVSESRSERRKNSSALSSKDAHHLPDEVSRAWWVFHAFNTLYLVVSYVVI